LHIVFARIFKRVLESLASSLSVLGLEATCPRQLGLASKAVSLPPPLVI